MPARSEIAYAAGFIDGEGCIIIDKRGQKGRTPTTYLKIEAYQIEPEPLDKLKSLFGGFVRYEGRGNGFRYRVDNEKAYAALIAMWPFLIVKKREASVAINYWRYRRATKEGKSSNSKIAMPMEVQLAYRQALKDLKAARPKRFAEILQARPELLPKKRQGKPATSFAAGKPR